MHIVTGTVIRNREVASGYYELETSWPGESPLPGQFLTLRTGPATDPLLRRPFAFSSYAAQADLADSDTSDAATSLSPPPRHARAAIIYERRGKATQRLSAAAPGDKLDLLGPLGRPFPDPASGSTPVLVAGGIGIGPIVFLATRLAEAGLSPVLIAGARTTATLPHLVLDRLPVEKRLCTEDGSYGIHGTVLQALENNWPSMPASPELYACGPGPMMAAVAELAERIGARCWVSLEQVIGCGVGACMGCAVRVKEPGTPLESARSAERQSYARVCTEGPVFDAREIVW